MLGLILASTQGKLLALCKFCGKSIAWLKSGRKNIPIEDDGTTHECEEFKKAQVSIKKIPTSSLSPDEIKRYEEAINTAKTSKKVKSR